MPPSPHAWRDRGAALAAWASPLLVVAMIGWLLLDLLLRGISAPQPDPSVADASLLERWAEFLTSAPQQAGRSGGILPMLVSTMLILAVCLAAALPIGVGTALLLSEVASAENRFARTVRSSLDVLASVPSIVFGLFGNALFCRWMGLRFSILSGGLTLACMVLPLLIRAAEEGFRAVSLGQRQAAFALGFSRTSTIFRIILPQAAPAIIVGLILAVGRALAETAALIFTSGYVDRMPGSLLDSGRSLSIHIYDLAMNVIGGTPHAYATALLLIVLLVGINAAARSATRHFLPRFTMSSDGELA